MIAMGAGTSHWLIPTRSIARSGEGLLCGCQGRTAWRGAYVGQEKVRPLTALRRSPSPRTGCAAAAPGLDAVLLRCSRAVALRGCRPDRLASPLGTGRFEGMHIADMNALGARLGWLPSYPSFDREPRARRRGERRGDRPGRVRGPRAAAGRLRFACEDPDARRRTTPGDDGLAGEPAGLLGQGPRVLPQAPAGRARQPRCGPRSPPRSFAPARSRGATGARGQARPAYDDRLSDDLQRAVLRRRAPGGDLV